MMQYKLQQTAKNVGVPQRWFKLTFTDHLTAHLKRFQSYMIGFKILNPLIHFLRPQDVSLPSRLPPRHVTSHPESKIQHRPGSRQFSELPWPLTKVVASGYLQPRHRVRIIRIRPHRITPPSEFSPSVAQAKEDDHGRYGGPCIHRGLDKICTTQ